MKLSEANVLVINTSINEQLYCYQIHAFTTTDYETSYLLTPQMSHVRRNKTAIILIFCLATKDKRDY